MSDSLAMRTISSMRRVRFFPFLVVLLCMLCPLRAAPPPTTAPQFEKDLYFLASDELEGRNVGTKGLEQAADYIAARFKSLGLQALPGCPDYFQTFTMSAALSFDPKTQLMVSGRPLELSKQYRPLGLSPDTSFAADVAFAGYGVSSDAYHYDDYANIDVKGKVVVVLRYEPEDEKENSQFTHDSWSNNSEFGSKAKVAAAHGAVALLMVNTSKYHDDDDTLIPLAPLAGKSDIPFIQLKRTAADDLLARGGSTKNLETLQKDIDTSGKPESFDLKGIRVAGTVAIERKKVPVKNVLAYVPGDKHSDEYVIVGAHYDHLGHGGPGSLAPGSEMIHHGADDNASGTVTVMSLADRIAHGAKLDRSVLFILFTGEEEGLIGSQYFVDHPPVPLDRMAAMLNLDMVGRIRNETLYTGGTGTAANFESLLADADKGLPLELKSIGKGGRGPSDHESFSIKKIPVLFFFSGMHPDYHRPTDEADKVNYQGISEVTDLSMNVIDALSKMPHQEYVSTFDAQAIALGGVASRGARVSLGVVPDYGTDESTVGVRITGTSPGTPAEKAGLKEGDVIVQIGEKKIDNLYDLTDFLGSAKPGQKVIITIERNKQRMQLEATLVERKG